MANNSASGGYLVGLVPNDKAIRDFFQALIKGITGLNDQLVRPMWQPDPPKQPAIGVNWCAFGIKTLNSDANAEVKISLDGLSGELTRHEDIELFAIFYGDSANGCATLLRDGLELSQNRDALRSNGIAYLMDDGIEHAPELINDRWYDRYDLKLKFNREIKRNYNVLSFLSASGIIVTDVGLSRAFEVFEQEDFLINANEHFLVDPSGEYFNISYKQHQDDLFFAENGVNFLINDNSEIFTSEVVNG